MLHLLAICLLASPPIAPPAQNRTAVVQAPAATVVKYSWVLGVDGRPVRANRKPDVELIYIGAEWCSVCPAAKLEAKKLEPDWKLRYFDLDEDADEKWVRYCVKNYGRAMPRWIVVIDDEPWYSFGAKRDATYLHDWLLRAANVWREDHGIEPVPFEAIGETADPNPVNREFFYREHWRMSPGSCGMAGCTIPGGGWVKELVKVPIEPQPPSQPATVRRGCPMCR